MTAPTYAAPARPVMPDWATPGTRVAILTQNWPAGPTVTVVTIAAVTSLEVTVEGQRGGFVMVLGGLMRGRDNARLLPLDDERVTAAGVTS